MTYVYFLHSISGYNGIRALCCEYIAIHVYYYFRQQQTVALYLCLVSRVTWRPLGTQCCLPGCCGSKLIIKVDIEVMEGYSSASSHSEAHDLPIITHTKQRQHNCRQHCGWCSCVSGSCAGRPRVGATMMEGSRRVTLPKSFYWQI